MPGTGSALRSRMDLDLRPLWLRVPPLLLSISRDSTLIAREAVLGRPPGI